MATDFGKRLLKRDNNNIVDFADKIVCTDKEEYREERDRLDDMVYQKLCDIEDIIEKHDLEFKKRGKWIYTEKGCVITCSYCGESLELCHPDGTEIRWSKHCPSCGALMDEQYKTDLDLGDIIISAEQHKGDSDEGNTF